MDIEGSHSMEWFFEDYVRGTGIPHYRIVSTTKRTDNGFVIQGKLFQAGVQSWFVAPVPLYSASGAYLGRVVAAGPETSFRIVTPREPGKIQIDPHMTLLCTVDKQPPAERYTPAANGPEEKDED